MIDKFIPEHYIQKYILAVLMHNKYARFRDMRPPKVDTNLYAYHLKLLVKNGFIEKSDRGYSLGLAGLLYVDRVSADSLNVRTQPKIITMIVLQNSDGDILLQKRTKQPYIDAWTLPYGKLHIDDSSVLNAAHREALEKLQLKYIDLIHIGDCYIRVYQERIVLSATLVHIFYGQTDRIVLNDSTLWVSPRKLSNHVLAPAVEKIITRVLSSDSYFFEEFNETYSMEYGSIAKT